MYDDTDGYGGIAEWSGPALGGASPVDVVRFQDLHRVHAPASAGLPEVQSFGGASGQQAPMHFGNTMASPDFAGFGYGRALTVSDTDGYEYKVETSTTPYTVTITKSPQGSTPRNVSASDKTAYDAIIAKAKEQYPYDFLPSTASASSEKKSARETEQRKEKKDAEEQRWDNIRASAGDIFEGFREGFTTRLDKKRELEVERQRVSDVKPPAEENKALTYALWAGGALLGIGAIVLLVKAVSDDDKKGE